MMNHIISEIKNGGKDRRCGSKNGHELHVTRESKRHKLEAYEQDSHHDDPGCKTSKNVASSLKETKAIDSCSMRRPLDSPENISLEHKTCNQPHIEPYAKYKFIYKFPWMPAAPCPNQDGSVIGVPEVTNTSSTTEEQREDGSVNEVPELTNTSNTTGEEPREKYPMILSAELVPSSTTEMEPGEAIKGFKDTGVIHDADIHSDGRHTAHNSQKQNRTEMSDNRVTEDKYKDQEMGCIQQATSETQAHREEFLSEEKPSTINVFINMVRNETCRMMTSIDMIETEATRLFGPEKKQLFFDMLAEQMPHFDPAGAITEFEPNMADSMTRQHVISFFEHANNEMTQRMTSLSRHRKITSDASTKFHIPDAIYH